jgi:hypothetical protein
MRLALGCIGTFAYFGLLAMLWFAAMWGAAHCDPRPCGGRSPLFLLVTIFGGGAALWAAALYGYWRFVERRTDDDGSG